MDCSMPGLSVLHYHPEFAQTHVHWASDVIQPSHALSFPSPQLLNLFPASGFFLLNQFFTLDGQSIGASASASFEYSRLISFRIDWVDLLEVQGTLKSLRQHRNLKASVLQHSAFFMVQILYPYMTTGKTIALTRRTFVGKVMSLLF